VNAVRAGEPDVLGAAQHTAGLLAERGLHAVRREEAVGAERGLLWAHGLRGAQGEQRGAGDQLPPQLPQVLDEGGAYAHFDKAS